jgi:hypothetical protein
MLSRHSSVLALYNIIITIIAHRAISIWKSPPRIKPSSNHLSLALARPLAH